MSLAASSNYYGSGNTGDYASATGSNFIPEVWSGKLQVKFYKSTVLGEITNNDWEGEIKGQGDKVYIRSIPTITISNYSKGMNLTSQVPTSTPLELNIDKGNQSVGGKDMIPIGNVGVSDTTTRYTLIRRANSTPLVKSTNSLGELWLIVGTDSGFEGLTDIYYGSIKVLLEQ